jgi:protein required for attachment to host cells
VEGRGGDILMKTACGEEVWDVEQSGVNQAGNKIWSVKKEREKERKEEEKRKKERKKEKRKEKRRRKEERLIKQNTHKHTHTHTHTHTHMFVCLLLELQSLSEISFVYF